MNLVEGVEEIIIINPDSDNDVEDILNDHEYIIFNRKQPKGQRWSVEDTYMLIEAYEKFKLNFSIAKRRKQVWKVIEEYLASKGVNVLLMIIDFEITILTVCFAVSRAERVYKVEELDSHL